MPIIQCPNCGRKFNLRKAPTRDFKCPKCFYTAPFSEILPSKNPAGVYNVTTQTGDPDTNPNQKTKLVKELQQPGSGQNPLSNDINQTVVVQELQQHLYFTVNFGGAAIGKIDLTKLSDGVYTLGRNSSDSTAQIRLSPDINMSRTHAYIKISRQNGGLTVMVQPAKPTNPLILNGKTIAMGKAATLTIGDQMVMGQTKIVFSK